MAWHLLPCAMMTVTFPITWSNYTCRTGITKNKETWTKNTKTMEKNIWHVGENNENLQNDVFEHWTTSAKTNWQCDSHHGTWQQMPCHLDEDTDVFVLALSFCSHIIANLYFHTVKRRESQIRSIKTAQPSWTGEVWRPCRSPSIFRVWYSQCSVWCWKIKVYKKLN